MTNELQKKTMLQRSENLTGRIRVAVVHDWMFQRRGGERVLESILNLFPQADVYYLFGNPNVLKLQHNHRFFPSFLAKVPFIEKIYKFLLPLLPLAIEAFDLTQYDLILSSSSCVAKGVIPSPLAKHIAYIHSPMRYAWDQEHRYFKTPVSLLRIHELLRRFFLNRLRVWDVTSAVRCDLMIANSQFVARRCQLYYGRNAMVIHPPVSLPQYNINGAERSGNEGSAQSFNSQRRKVLLFGAWVPYKRMYSALELLLAHDIPVIAAGHGAEFEKAVQNYGPQIEYVRMPKDSDILAMYARAHVLLLPALEDFGIIPLEATAAGLWVVAPNQGGSAETVIHGKTGFTFHETDPQDMLTQVKHALARDITAEDRQHMQTHAHSFGRSDFEQKYLAAVEKTLQN